MITSLLPFTTSVGCRIDFRYSNGFSCGAPHLPIASICAGAAFSFTSGSRFSVRSRKRVNPKMIRIVIGGAEDFLRLWSERSHALAAARAGADQYEAPDEIGGLKCDFLRDKAADRKAEHIDFRQSQRIDEGHRVGAHFLERGGHL